MQETLFYIETKEDLARFILTQSKEAKNDFYELQKKGFNLNKNISLLELYEYVKSFRFDDTDYKSQLLSRPLGIFTDQLRYFNCAGKVYYFVCLLRWMRDNNFPVSKNKFFICLSFGKNFSHIYIEVDLKGKLFPFDFTYDTKQNAILFPLTNIKTNKYRVEII